MLINDARSTFHVECTALDLAAETHMSLASKMQGIKHGTIANSTIHSYFIKPDEGRYAEALQLYSCGHRYSVFKCLSKWE